MKSVLDRNSKICRNFIHCAAVFVAVFLLLADGTHSAAAPGTAAREATPEWKIYNYIADGFRAEFPVEPLFDKREITTAAGSLELHSYKAQSGSMALFIGVSDYGSQAAGKPAETLLQGAKTGALANSGSHLVKEKKISFDNQMGIEFEAESETAHMTARLYLVNTRLYQVVVVAPIRELSAEAAHFLNSFQFAGANP